MRDGKMLGLVLVMVIACIIGVAVEKRDQIRFRTECEKAGGEYHRSYRSDPICLKPGSTIIPVATAVRG